MGFDAHKNLAVASVATAPSPASSGTSLVVGAGQGARFPAVPFNCTIWPVDMAPDPTTAEVVRVTARTTDTLTITRAQEGTTARTVLAGDLIAATITAQSLTDIESGVNFPLITTAGNVTVGGQLLGPAGNFFVRPNTNDGADTGQTVLCGGGGSGSDRGAAISALGNEVPGAGGDLYLVAGQPTGKIYFYAGPVERGRIHPSGGFSWGGTTDPGAGTFCIGNNGANGSIWLNATGSITLAATVSTADSRLSFFTPSGHAGAVVTTGTTTAYATTSDARLKTSLGPHTDLDVLRRTVIHDFVWRPDGTLGRGVFAQEAAEVAPFAVAIGTDDRDAGGNLTQPWGVDYSKYVPDLIVGWQDHDATVIELRGDVAVLTARLVALEDRRIVSARTSLMSRVRNFINGLFPAWVTP